MSRNSWGAPGRAVAPAWPAEYKFMFPHMATSPSETPPQSEYGAETSRSSRASRRCASARACTSATPERGLHHLVFEVVDNSIDEALAGFCNEIDVTIHVDNSVTVEDDGRGIPVDIHTDRGHVRRRGRADQAPRGRQVRQGRLQGLRRPARRRRRRVNALSEWLEVEVRRDGKVYQQQLRARQADAPLKEIGVTDKRGTKITFKPDPEIFETTRIQLRHPCERLRELAFLNRGIAITIDDERDAARSTSSLRGRHRRSSSSTSTRTRQPIHDEVIYLQRRAATSVERRGRDAVERRLQRERLRLRQQHQHHRGRHAPLGFTHRAHPRDQQVREGERPAQEGRRDACRATTCARA